MRGPKDLALAQHHFARSVVEQQRTSVGRKPGLGPMGAGHDLPDIHTMLQRCDASWPEIPRWIDEDSPGLSLVVAAIIAITDPTLLCSARTCPPISAQD